MNLGFMKVMAATPIPYCPVPVSATVSGLVRSESATLNVALRVNLALGANRTLTVQVAPDARVEPQVLVWEKSPGFVPTIEIDVMVKVPGPTLPTVTFWLALVVPTNWDAKVWLVGLVETMVPVPLSATLCGLPGALSVTVRLALRTAATCGRNVILTLQDAAAANVVPQVFDEIANSEALVPVIAIVVMVNVAVPLFLTVTVWADEVTKSRVTGKVIEVGDSVTAGPRPVPESDTD
jgi:hypothetical protein